MIRPMSPDEMREFIKSKYHQFNPVEPWRVSKVLRSFLTEKEYRQVLLYLFGTSSSKEVDGRKLAVLLALSGIDDEPNEIFRAEIHSILRRSLLDKGQLEFDLGGL